MDNSNVSQKKFRTIIKNRSFKITVILTLLILLISAVMIIRSMLVKDNISDKYSADPNPIVMVKALVDMGWDGRLTLTPQEVTDTICYFMDEKITVGAFSYQYIYFDVADDGENALMIVPFEYNGTKMVLQINTAISVEKKAEKSFFALDINQVKIGEVVLPKFARDILFRRIAKGSTKYENGRLLVDASFLLFDINGKKVNLDILAFEITPAGFYIEATTLKDLLSSALSGLFSSM